MTPMSEHATAADADLGRTDFDDLPYVSLSFPESRPENLAAVAAFFGLSAPRPETARILELGCASGGNLIPMAARMPGATCVGYDLSRRHVDMAAARIAALGLTNVEILQGDIGNPGLVTGTFDYIICHGVFSWVPPHVQDRILAICRDNLAPEGIAYISYNVLPGWQLRRIVRDIFMFGDEPGQSARDRVARGRWLLGQIAQGTEEGSTYGRLLRSEAKGLAEQEDGYLLGEFLADENLPCYFHEFLGRARANGLAWLGESRVSSTLPTAATPALDQNIRALAGPDVEKQGQYFDFLQGRQFRQSLLVHAGRAGSIDRRPDPRRLAQMHLSARVHRAADQPDDGGVRLQLAGGPAMTTNDPVVVAALEHLGRIWPRTATPRELLQLSGPHEAGQAASAPDRLLEALLRLCLAGFVGLLAAPVRGGGNDSPRPAVWKVVRADATLGLGHSVSLAHLPLRMDRMMAHVLPMIDGTRTRSELVDLLTRTLAENADDFGLIGIDTTDRDRIRGVIETMLADLAARCLLAPGA